LIKSSQGRKRGQLSDHSQPGPGKKTPRTRHDKCQLGRSGIPSPRKEDGEKKEVRSGRGPYRQAKPLQRKAQEKKTKGSAKRDS